MKRREKVDKHVIWEFGGHYEVTYSHNEVYGGSPVVWVCNRSTKNSANITTASGVKQLIEALQEALKEWGK